MNLNNLNGAKSQRLASQEIDQACDRKGTVFII
jgi:hypothetical protein